jgi:hypothetical protein
VYQERVFAHERDIAWLIALWLAIHGGDPGPEGGVVEIDETTVLMGAAFISQLSQAQAVESLDEETLHQRLGAIGVEFAGEERAEARAGGRTVCTQVPGGRMYCFYVPEVKAPPPGEPGR